MKSRFLITMISTALLSAGNAQAEVHVVNKYSASVRQAKITKIEQLKDKTKITFEYSGNGRVCVYPARHTEAFYATDIEEQKKWHLLDTLDAPQCPSRKQGNQTFSILLEKIDSPRFHVIEGTGQQSGNNYWNFKNINLKEGTEVKKHIPIAQDAVVKVGELMWMRCSVGQTWSGTTCTGKPKGFERSDAMNQKLNYAGFSDWRPPSVQELNSLVRCPSGRSPVDSENYGRCLGDRGEMGREIWRKAYGEMNYKGQTALIDLHHFPGTPLGDYWTYETSETWFNYVSFIDGESAGGANNRAFLRGGVFLRMVRDDYSDKVQVSANDFDIRVKVSAQKSDPSSLKHDMGIMKFDSVGTSNQIHMSYAILPKVKQTSFNNRNISLVLNVVIDKRVETSAFGIGVSQSQPEFKTIKISLNKANGYAAKGTRQLFDIQSFSKIMGTSMQVSNAKPRVSVAAIYYE